MKSNYKILIFYVVLIAVILVATAALFGNQASTKIIYSDIDKLFYEEQVREFEIDSDNQLTILKRDGTVVTFKLRSLDSFWSQFGDMIETQFRNGTIEAYNIAEPVEIPWWINLLPYAIVIILFIVFWFFIINQFAGGAGGKDEAPGRPRRAALHPGGDCPNGAVPGLAGGQLRQRNSSDRGRRLLHRVNIQIV